MKQAFTIEIFFKLILKYKYYFIIAVALSIFFTTAHILKVNKKYVSLINLKLSPDYFSIFEINEFTSIEDLTKFGKFRTFGNLFIEEFFDEENLNNLFDPKFVKMTSKTEIISDVKLRKKSNVEIKIFEEYLEIKVFTNNLTYIKELTNYITKINHKITEEIIEQRKYFLINLNEMLNDKNIRYFNMNNIEVSNSTNLYDLVIEQKKVEKLQKYILENNVKLFSINYATLPELIYPKKINIFINYFLALFITTFVFVLLKETKFKSLRKLG